MGQGLVAAQHILYTPIIIQKVYGLLLGIPIELKSTWSRALSSSPASIDC
jgi:hypothetical protein